MATPQAALPTLPNWFRWATLVWFLIWLPAYWHTWGAVNFLHLCDVALVLGCVGVWTNSVLLISSQAVSALLVGVVWALDTGTTFFLGRHVLGGTEYLFDAGYPLWVRLLTLFHAALPALLLWALHRTGYDRRGWALQSAIALPVFVASRFTSAAQNINFAFTDPFFHRAWGPAPVHIVTSWLFMVFIVYLPTHLLLKRLFPPPQA
jgi:hypothetical protein